MSFIWSVVAFVLGVIEFCTTKRVEWVFTWFVISALYIIAFDINRIQQKK